MNFLTIILASALLLTACKQEAIETYRIPKEAAPALAMPVTERPLTWKAPAAWKEQPASSMRLASFIVPGPQGRQADFSIVVLSGEAGGDLANVNRWRDQIKLEPLSQDQLDKNSEKISPAGRSMRLINFVSREPLGSDPAPRRLVAATYTREGKSWFFKLVGDDETVRAALPAFRQFLTTLRFRSS